jgi:hypothetical protein
MLRNPKYTGYMVWNRRARKSGNNRANRPEDWVWSPEPTHPAIITREEYDAVPARSAVKGRSKRRAPQRADHLVEICPLRS